MTVKEKGLYSEPLLCKHRFARIQSALLNYSRVLAAKRQRTITKTSFAIMDEDLDPDRSTWRQSRQMKGPAGTKQQAQTAIAVFLTEENPDKAWAYAQDLPSNYSSSVMSQVLSQMSAIDPQRAIGLLEQLPKGQTRNNALNQFIVSWMNQDPEAAQDYVKDLPANEQSAAIQSSMWYLAQSDLAGTIRLVESLQPNSQTPNLYSNLVSQWAQSDPDAAQKWVKSLPPGAARSSAESSLLNSLAQNDPLKAMEFLKGEQVTNQNRHDISQIAATVAKDDPDAAFAWIDSFGVQGSAYKKLLSSTISQLASYDSAKAADYVLNFEDKAVRKDLIANLVLTWTRQDYASAKTWIDSNLETGEKMGAYRDLMGSLSWQDPIAAKELLEEASQGLSEDESNKYFKSSIGQIANGWGQSDPTAAAAWLQTQPDDTTRYRAIASVVDQWVEFDSAGAANFVLTLAEGDERDGAIKSLVNDLRQWEPDSAFLWANSISDDDSRKGQIRRAVNSWKETDPAAAREAVLGANLPEEVRSNMLKDLDSE